MSKIKELFAEANGDDDLVLKDEAMAAMLLLSDVYNAVEKIMIDSIDEIKDHLNDAAIFEKQDDGNGGCETYWVNYEDSCHNWSDAYLEGYIEKQSLDISDEQYMLLNDMLAKWLIGYLEDFMNEQTRKCVEDSEDDWDRLTSYNQSTIIK